MAGILSSELALKTSECQAKVILRPVPLEQHIPLGYGRPLQQRIYRYRGQRLGTSPLAPWYTVGELNNDKTDGSGCLAP